MALQRSSSIRFCWNKDWDYGSYDRSQLMDKLVVKVREVNPEAMAKVKAVIEETYKRDKALIAGK
jgi:phage terminase large subunit GpA-like protein